MVSLQLLGGCAVRTEGGAADGEAAQARRLAVLALLASAPTGGLSREKLIGFLWPEAASEQARHNLSDSLYQLRRALGSAVIIANGEWVRLNRDLVSCDATRFQAALERGDLERAVAVYAGPFLDGFYVKDAGEFEHWVEKERQRLADAYAAALERLARAAAADGDHVGAIRWWKQLAAHDRYASRYIVGLMEALAAAGDPANALLLADEHAALLRDTLGVDPPDEMAACAARLRAELTRPAVATAPSAVRRESGHPPTRTPDADSDITARPGSATLTGSRSGLRRRALVTVTAVAAGATLLFVITWATPSLFRTEVAATTIDVAIAPFTYRGSDELRYLAESMAPLLSTTLEGFDGLHAVAPRVDHSASGTGKAATEREWTRQVAARLGADRVVTGDVVEVNGRLRIDARLHRVSGGRDEPDVATVTGTAGDFHTLADRLTGQLLLLLVGPVQEIHSVAARTTDSLNALKAYLEGEAHRRAGRFDSAFVAFRHAVEIDSTFALAWHGMAVSASWETMLEWDPGMDATLKAVQFSGRLPGHTQLVLRAYAAIMHGDEPEAERLARAVLGEHPDDVHGWFILAWAGCLNPFFGRQVSEVREAMERAYRYDPYDPDYQSGAAWFATREHDWARLDSIWGNRYATRAVRAFGSGDSAAGRQILVEASTANAEEVSRVSGWTAMTLQDIPAATRLARAAAPRSGTPTGRSLIYVQLAQLEWALGRWRAAVEALDEVARHDPPWATLYKALWAAADVAPVDRPELERLRAVLAAWDATHVRASVTNTGARAHDLLAPQLRLYAIGRLTLRLGELDSVLAIASELEAMGNPPSALTFAADRAQSLRAHVAFMRGAYEEALAALDAQPRRIRIQWLYGDTYFYPCPEDRFLHGEILRHLGRDEEALSWYATIQDITAYDAHYLAMAHLRSAEISERLGDAAGIEYHYAAFVRIWGQCDTELQPMVDRARRVLGGASRATTG